MCCGASLENMGAIQVPEELFPGVDPNTYFQPQLAAGHLGLQLAQHNSKRAAAPHLAPLMTFLASASALAAFPDLTGSGWAP